MSANSFQNLSTHGVASLLISGQAAVLYGAATFSEDIDLWIEPTPADYRWAPDNLFTLAELRRLFEEHSAAASAVFQAAPLALRELAQQVMSGREPAELTETEVATWMHERMQRLQQADRAYWRPIIGELRQLRAIGQLAGEGTPV